MSDENEATVTALYEKLQRAVEIGKTVFKILVRRAAELRQIAGARNPVVAAGVDDEAVKVSPGELLAENRQRRQVKIHRDAMHEQERQIALPILWRE